MDLQLDIIENEDSSFNDCVQFAFKGMILSGDATFPLKVRYGSQFRPQPSAVDPTNRPQRKVIKIIIRKKA